jgi:ParB family chromosome partitioning protein
LEKIKNNSISLNKAYELIKSKEKKSSSASKKQNQTGKGINSESFRLGVLFVLSELEKGKKKSQIIKDKRIAKLELEELVLSEDEISRITQRFGE